MEARVWMNEENVIAKYRIRLKRRVSVSYLQAHEAKTGNN